MTGEGEGERRGGVKKKTQERDCSLLRAAIWKWGGGKRLEIKSGGWCEDESRTECRPGRKEKRKKTKQKKSGNPLKI